MAEENTKTNTNTNLQSTDSKADAQGKGTDNTNEPKTPSVEELMAQLATERADKQRYKNSIDKLTHELSENKKALRAKQTAEEQENEARIEKEEQQKAYVAELELYKQKNEALRRYMTIQNMPADLAEKAAEAEVSGDMDTLAAIQKQFSESVLKTAKQEWMKTVPQPQFGTGSESMSKEEIVNITDPIKRREAILANLGQFK